jgi:Zn-dependent alcohol dehydrogenase
MIKTYSFKNIDDAINDMNTGKTIKPVIIFNE